MAELLVIQMSGAPGAGKSTIAREIHRRQGTAILDFDIVKSALLARDVPWMMAGRGAYSVMDALARSLLDQGISVILDSPCYYQDLLDRSLRMAEEKNACYRYIECVNEDLTEIGRRLRSRTPLRCQRRDLGIASPDYPDAEAVSGEDLFREWIANMKRPSHSYLRVDTSRPLVDCFLDVIAFLDQCRES